MIKLDLPGYSLRKRSAIDGSNQFHPIVFAVVRVDPTQQGVLITFVAWVEIDGKLEAIPNPDIIRTPDA